jgi:SAM-dependent methyltransferase
MAEVKLRGSGVAKLRGRRDSATAQPRNSATDSAQIDEQLAAWHSRPLLREIYAGFHRRIAAEMPSGDGAVVELGSGIGSFPEAILTDVFVRDWLDLACSAYRLPFRDGAARAVVLFDVFHHLARPVAALRECARVLRSGGRVIIFDVYVSLTSFPVYHLHPERVRWRAPIDLSPDPPERDDDYYAAQGNATRMFFRPDVGRALARPDGLKPVLHEAFSAWHYLLSGGFSKPALYPRRALPFLRWLDERLPAKLFGGRCLVVLEKQ